MSSIEMVSGQELFSLFDEKFKKISMYSLCLSRQLSRETVKNENHFGSFTILCSGKCVF